MKSKNINKQFQSKAFKNKGKKASVNLFFKSMAKQSNLVFINNPHSKKHWWLAERKNK